MRLQPDPVDLDPVLLQHSDNSEGCLSLLARTLNVVVIIVELHAVGLDPSRRAEGKLDVLLAENLVEERLAVRAILVERLIDYIPCVAWAPVVLHDLGDVLDDGRTQRLWYPGGALNPRG